MYPPPGRKQPRGVYLAEAVAPNLIRILLFNRSVDLGGRALFALGLTAFATVLALLHMLHV